VTLVGGVSPDVLLRLVDRGRGCSMKDSFGDLDLAPAGFEILFRAEWLRLPGGAVAPAWGPWSRVETPSALERWESAWGPSPVDGPFFRPTLLAESTVAVLARGGGDRPVAGAVACLSPSVIGLTNVFHESGDLESAFAGAASAARAHWGPLPVVGYESGAALDAARGAGFSTIGELAVWVDGAG